MLRAEVGQTFEIATPNGIYLGTIEGVGDQEVAFALGQKISDEQRHHTALLLAIYKFDRFDWAIEKATELGATEIVPAISRRTEKHLAQAAQKRVERWRRIAREAAQQSRQASTPEIRDPQPLKQALSAIDGLRVLLAEEERGKSLWEALDQPADAVGLAIGPEGGWTKDEIQLFAENGWLSASLGNSILRAETAAIAALAVVNQKWLQHGAGSG